MTGGDNEFVKVYTETLERLFSHEVEFPCNVVASEIVKLRNCPGPSRLRARVKELLCKKDKSTGSSNGVRTPHYDRGRKPKRDTHGDQPPNGPDPTGETEDGPVPIRETRNIHGFATKHAIKRGKPERK